MFVHSFLGINLIFKKCFSVIVGSHTVTVSMSVIVLKLNLPQGP